MLPTPENYRVFPSVLPVGKEVRLTVLAAEPTFLPREEACYTLTVVAVDGDENYYDSTQITELSLSAEAGVLRFAYTFPAEGAYRIRLADGATRLCDTVVYALKGAESFPHIFTLVFAACKTAEGVLSAVKAGNTVAVEATGSEYERRYRAYGSLRLVSYAQFLLRYFYPNATRIAAGEGGALRAYAMGECDGAAVEAFAAMAEDYRGRFFGRIPPVLPNRALRERVAAWRDRQLTEGPPTCGSLVDFSPSRKVKS